MAIAHESVKYRAVPDEMWELSPHRICYNMSLESGREF